VTPEEIDRITAQFRAAAESLNAAIQKILKTFTEIGEALTDLPDDESEET